MAARLSTLSLLAATALAWQRPNDEVTFQKVCGDCHSVSLISDFKSITEWEETVDAMVERGAKMTGAERAAALRYLATHFGRVNVNAASAEELAQVLDISLDAAKSVVAHRPYRSLDELRKAGALPAMKLDSLRDHIAFR
jgi:radical SAM superfamily enzyme with C-terminal helix-hairpin-helix motif